jgi:hypothetical protein
MMMTQCPGASGSAAAGFREPIMGGAKRWVGVLRALTRGGAMAALALATSACATFENLTPQLSDFKLPDAKIIAPTQVTAYARPVTAGGRVEAADLVDTQGVCAGVAPAPVSNDAPADTVPRAAGGVPPSLPTRAAIAPESIGLSKAAWYRSNSAPSRRRRRHNRRRRRESRHRRDRPRIFRSMLVDFEPVKRAACGSAKDFVHEQQHRLR